jgi:hypothetical protein
VAARLSFPPIPPTLKGRAEEIRLLASRLRATHPGALALVGPGGSGKSTLAAALGHRVAQAFPGGVHWFRVGAWSASTLLTMLAIRFGTSRRHVVPGLRRHLGARPGSLVVLDNHEDDAAVAELLNALSGTATSWVITARRCLLAGVTVYPVNPPMVLQNRPPYRSVASLTQLLRHNPLALSVADALVSQGAASVSELERYLLRHGADRVQVIADEDDLPEVRLLVDWVFRRLDPAERRLLGVLAHAAGDHVDQGSLLALCRAGRRGDGALERLLAWRLVQEPFAGRFTVHATVRRALIHRLPSIGARLFTHYMNLLEQDPGRLDAEQTHLFAAMDFAAREGQLADRMRLARLLRGLGL